MEPRRGPVSGFGLGHKYLALGLRFAGGIILFMLAGLALDRWLGLLPLLTIAGTLTGGVLSFLSVYRELMDDEAKARRRRSGNTPEAGG